MLLPTNSKSFSLLYNIILGIETSCDETGVAIYDRQYAKTHLSCRASTLQSQNDTHAQYGGVVPELASRDHVKYLQQLTQQCLDKANLRFTDIDGFAYTQGPGLAGALLTGASFTRALAYGLKKPCLGIHHMEGHLLSPMISHPDIKPPFLGLLISGGHTLLVLVKKLGQYHVLGQSIDDAIGEAFDKSAKLLGLSYPGGYPLSQLAQQGDAKAYSFSHPMTAKAGKALSPQNRFNFSFSGLKTEVRNTYQKEIIQAKNPAQEHIIKVNIAASFERVVAETLSIKIQSALDYLGNSSDSVLITRLLVAGGVAANHTIRQSLQQLSIKNRLQLFIPEPRLCTDNGEMIAYVGWLRFNHLSLKHSSLSHSHVILPRWNLHDLRPLH